MQRSAARRTRRGFLRGSLGLATLGLLSGCAGGPPRAPEPSRAPRIGFLAPGEGNNPWFLAGLAEHGYVEGRTAEIEYRYARETLDDLLPPRPSWSRSPSTSS